MKRLSLFIWTLAVVLLTAGGADAQLPNSLVGGSKFNPPLPPPPAVPPITVPKVPQMDVPSVPISQAVPHRSFSDRVSRCLDEAAASGMNQADRATYSRMCANQ
jgi:hypothetical protein